MDIDKADIWNCTNGISRTQIGRYTYRAVFSGYVLLLHCIKVTRLLFSILHIYIADIGCFIEP